MTSAPPLAELHPSPPRRIFAIGVLWSLAGLLVVVTMSQPPGFVWQVFLFGMAALSAYGAEAIRRATSVYLVLTRDGLFDSTGQQIAVISAMARVDRGAFAFKPSNGFLLVLNDARAGRVWAPGLYWRMGRRVGVGGVTHAHQGRAMAEAIALELARRDG